MSESIIEYEGRAWTLEKVSLDKFIEANLEDGGFYKNITEEANDGTYYEFVIQGNKDTLFCMKVGMGYEITYYLGYLKSSSNNSNDLT